jgi:hypothetical protein
MRSEGEKRGKRGGNGRKRKERIRLKGGGVWPNSKGKLYN